MSGPYPVPESSWIIFPSSDTPISSSKKVAPSRFDFMPRVRALP
jgi:hypothetical protein